MCGRSGHAGKLFCCGVGETAHQGDAQMHRHGSRYPLASELTYVTNLVSKLSNSSSALSSSKAQHSLPKELQFLTGGYTSTLGHDDLSAPGRRELFDSGVASVKVFRKRMCKLMDLSTA